MKTAKQWMDENDPAWGDCSGKPELTEEVIKAIQLDVLQHAEKCAEYILEHALQDDPNTGEPLPDAIAVAHGANLVAAKMQVDQLPLMTMDCHEDDEIEL